MSKIMTQKTSFNFTMPVWFKQALEELSVQKGRAANDLIIETMLKVYPKTFETAKNRNVRRVIPPG